MRIALAVALLCSVPLLALGQLSSGDSSYLLRLEHVKEGEDVCVLLQSNGNYHFERVLSDKALVYEGSISRTSLQGVKTAVSSDEILHLAQDRIPAHVVSSSYDELGLDIARVEGWQQLRFPDSDSRKPFHQSLDPLLKWVDSLPSEGRVQLNEDEGKNNCLPPRREDVHLTRRQETASPVPAGAPPSTVPSYMLRILMDRLGPGEARRTCAIVYPNGFYHLEKSNQTYYVGGVYQPDVINAGLGGRIKADVFEQFLDPRATKELRKLLDNPELMVSRHSSMPVGIHYSDAEITFVFIPREDRLQQLTFSNYFGADNPQTHMSAGGHATRHVDSAAGLLSPLQKWVGSNIESRKAARLKEAYGNNCTASSALALPSEISSELAQVVPSDFDSASAAASKPIPRKPRPERSSADASPTAAEDSAARGPTANEPAISLRVTTRMVLVDVVASDKNGTPIADLHPTDLKVQEDGRPQSIKFFSHASSNVTRPGKSLPPQLPPDIYSNRPQYRPATGPVVLLLLDGLNTASADQAHTRRQMLSYLRTLKPNQSVAVFALGTDLLLLQDFTSDPQVLIAALEKYSSNDSLLLARGLPTMITPQMADVMSTGMTGSSPLQNLIRFNQENAVNATDDRVRLTLAALRAVGRDMIGYPGRKNLIWVSSGFPVSIELSGRNSELSQDYAADLSRTAALLSQAQVSVYPVDALGLISNLQDTPSANETVPTVQSSDTRAFGTEELTRIAPQVMDSHMAMEQVARDTGGGAFYNVNNLATALSAGVEDGTSYYTLGYYPENKNWDGKFRKINLVTERKDVKLRYRPGYYAFDSTQPGGPLDARQEQSRLQELLRAIKDPLPATGVAFWAHLVRPHNGDSSTYVEFLVDANTISFAENGTRHDCDLDFAAFAVAPNGTVSNTVVENVRTPLPAWEYASVHQRGLPFRMQIKLPPKGEDLRLAVRDNRTTLLGTLTIVNPVNSSAAQAKQ